MIQSCVAVVIFFAIAVLGRQVVRSHLHHGGTEATVRTTRLRVRALIPSQSNICCQLLDGRLEWNPIDDDTRGAEALLGEHLRTAPGLVRKIDQLICQLNRIEVYGTLTAHQQKIFKQLEYSRSMIVANINRELWSARKEEFDPDHYLKRDEIDASLLNGKRKWNDQDANGERIRGADSLFRIVMPHAYPRYQHALELLDQLEKIRAHRGALTGAQMQLESDIDEAIPLLRGEADRQLGGESGEA